jgi:hypothetical protein
MPRDEFVTVYGETMDRLGAAAHWRLPRGYISDLRSTVEARVHLCVVELNGTLAAAALLSEVDGIVEYHLSGTSPGHVAASPTKLLIDQAARWARQRGDRVFHLAGSLRRNDPLIHFKRGFSPLHDPVYSWNLVTDSVAYSQLVARRDRLEGPSETRGSGATGEYFPAYRRPAVSMAGEHSPDHSAPVG